MRVEEILLSVLLSELVGLFLLLMFVLGAIIVEKVVDVKSLRLRVSRVKELEEKNGTLYEETETLRRNVQEYKQLAIMYEEESHKAKKKMAETIDVIFNAIEVCGYTDAQDDFSKGYNAAIDDACSWIKTRFSEGEK